MVKFFKSDENGLKETTGFSENGIITVTSPTQDETRMLSSLLNFEPDFITDPLDLDERARIDFDDHATEIIIKVPFKDEEDIKITYKTIPLGIVIGANFVLFVSRYRVPFLETMIERSQLDPNKRSRMIFQIFYRNALLFLSYLKEINKISDATEEKLHES